MGLRNTKIEDWDMKLDPEDFDFFRSSLLDLAGISLNDAKLDLVQTRLRSRVIKLKMNSFAEYGNYLKKNGSSDEEWQVFINLLTTNKTSWFREPEHFEYIASEFLPLWEQQGKNHLSVWCAASSTGEEAYSLSLLLNSILGKKGISYSIVASDIDTRVLSVAQNGVYERKNVEMIPARFHKEFSYGTGDISNWIKIKGHIKEHVTFKQLNLSKLPDDFPEAFDLILCRNVFIYFNSQTIETVVKKFYSSAALNAVLIIAHAESLQNIPVPWEYKNASIYTKGKIFR